MPNAQEWLEENYPKNGTCVRKEYGRNHKDFGKKRSEIKKLDIINENLTGNLDLQGFTNLTYFYCSSNNLTNLNFLTTLPHPEKLTNFFDEILSSQYISMFSEKHDKVVAEMLDKGDEKLEYKLISAERRLFRELLIDSGRGIKCEILNCRINLDKVLIASHIRPVNLIRKDKKLSKEEKLRQISDCNNGFLFCRNHDALFDKFLITFSEEGKITASSDVEKFIDVFDLSLDKVALEIKNQETISYLQYHQKEFNFRERNE